jgi:hypothetical protein
MPLALRQIFDFIGLNHEPVVIGFEDDESPKNVGPTAVEVHAAGFYFAVFAIHPPVNRSGGKRFKTQPQVKGDEVFVFAVLALVYHFVEVFHGGGVGIEVAQGDEQSIARYFDHVFPMHFLLVDVVDPIAVMGAGRFCPNGLQFVGRQQ